MAIDRSVDLGKADRAMDLHNPEGRKLNKYFVRIPFRTPGLGESGLCNELKVCGRTNVGGISLTCI